MAGRVIVGTLLRSCAKGLVYNALTAGASRWVYWLCHSGESLATFCFSFSFPTYGRFFLVVFSSIAGRISGLTRGGGGFFSNYGAVFFSPLFLPTTLSCG